MKKQNLRSWIRHSNSLSLFLPDGPYGRPFDNQYFFQDLAEQETETILTLSDGISLKFSGSIETSIEGNKLFIRGFDRFDFILDNKIDRTFYDGVVCLYRF